MHTGPLPPAPPPPGRAARAAGRRQSRKRLRVAAITGFGAVIVVGVMVASLGGGSQPLVALLAGDREETRSSGARPAPTPKPTTAPALGLPATPAPTTTTAPPQEAPAEAAQEQQAQQESAQAAAPPPDRAGAGVMPTPDNTGVPAGVALRPSGPVTVDQPGAVVQGLDVDGCVQINASRVTIKNTRIRCGDQYPVRLGDGVGGVLLEDVEIDGLGNPGGVAVAFGNYTLRRGHVHNIGDGPRLGTNTTVEFSLVHDIRAQADGHNDGMQATQGSNIVVRGNRVENLNTQTSAILIGADQGDIDNVLVEGNWLNGGGYTLYAGGDEFTATNVRILNNRFGRDHVEGPKSVNQDGIRWEGNAYADGESID
jgi:hypothetical protein